jgi:dTDP-4-amino-4,6-dideoxygalactose transaminase
MYINWLNRKTYDLELVDKLLETTRRKNHYTNYGPLVYELECYFAEVLKIDSTKSVFLTSNGTTALHAIIAALNLKKKKEHKFATQDFTFPSSVLGPARGSQILDMTHEHEVDLSQINEEVDGLIITNVFGNCLEIDRYETWAEENGKFLIIDNAASPFTFYGGKNSLNYGTASFVSLHHTKPLGFGEGGLIVIDNEYADEVQQVINFGFDSSRNWNEWGSNYRMSDLSAAFVFQHVQKNFLKMVEHHTELREIFYAVAEHNGWRLWNDKSDGQPFLSSLLFFSEKSSTRIKNLKNFEWKKYYKPLAGLPITTEIYKDIYCLPCHTDVTVKDILLLKQ